MKVWKAGIIGCGNIADVYVRNIQTYFKICRLSPVQPSIWSTPGIWRRNMEFRRLWQWKRFWRMTILTWF